MSDDIPKLIRDTNEAVFQRHIIGLGHVECDEETGATVHVDRCMKQFGPVTVTWEFKRWSKPPSEALLDGQSKCAPVSAVMP